MLMSIRRRARLSMSINPLRNSSGVVMRLISSPRAPKQGLAADSACDRVSNGASLWIGTTCSELDLAVGDICDELALRVELYRRALASLTCPGNLRCLELGPRQKATRRCGCRDGPASILAHACDPPGRMKAVAIVVGARGKM